MKYKVFIIGAIFGTLCSLNISNAQADFYTDYNTSVLDTIFQNNKSLTENAKKTPPVITNDISKSNIDELDYNAELLGYEKYTYNYIIFYSVDEKKEETELFRLRINKTGEGQITDKSLLNKLKPNTRLVVKIMALDVDDNGNIGNIRYSNPSEYYYTQKIAHLVVKEDNSIKVNRNILLTGQTKNDSISLYPYEVQQYYRPDKYYTYNEAEVTLSDGSTKKIEDTSSLPYDTKNITVSLAKNKDNWKNVFIEYPTIYKSEKNEYSVKVNSSLSELFKDNTLKTSFNSNADYSFVGYFLNNTEVNEKSTVEVNTDITLIAKFKTKIVLDNGDSKKEVELLTKDNLGNIDTNFFNKDKYHVESYSIYDKKTNEKIKDTSKLEDEIVDSSVIVKANYRENTNTIYVRQDDYNKRFGKVEDSIKDVNIEWGQTKPLGELLTELREKIKPNSGYETVFRINREVVDEKKTIDSDITLEIYFKKIDEDWVTVKFTGNGIDKFLSDGQEILYGNRLDSSINLPTATGETNHEFLGWQANVDYEKYDSNNQKVSLSKNSLLQTNELGSVIAKKGQNLEFTAVYRKKFQVKFVPTASGSINLSKGDSQTLEVDEFDSIGDATQNNKILVMPKSHYSLSYFTANKTVMVKTEIGYKQIFLGEKIEETDLYNIVPTSDLEITPKFEFLLFSSNIDDILNQIKIKDIDDALNLNLESTESIRKILGPLYYLR